MRILRFIPFLIAPMLIYAAIAFTAGANMEQRLAANVFTLHMVSGDALDLSLGALLLTLAVACQFFEIVRSARPTTVSLVENMVSAISWIIGLVVFLLVRGFGTTTFFLMLLLLLADYLTDAAVMVFTARRTVDVNRS
jgi:hypothetical protein